MSFILCKKCMLRAKYDTNHKSFLGKLWRWHTNWCPGWKFYMKSLSDEERAVIAKEYNMSKYI